MEERRMEASVTRATACGCSHAFGAALPPERRRRLALPLFFLVVSLTTIRPAAVAKEPRDTCEEIQALRGIQDTRAPPGKLFFYPISPFAFQGTITHYKVTLANGSALPKWLEYNHNISSLQGLPMLEESGEYHLTVVAHGEACGLNTPTATADFALHVHNHITVCEKLRSTDQKSMDGIIYSERLHARDISVTFAEIMIYHTTSSLAIQERLSLIYTMAEYLHLDPSFLTLNPFKEPFTKKLCNLTVVSEDIKYISTMENHYTGLCWPVGFGVFAMLYELVQVLRHNVRSSHLSQLLGYEIVGWRILQKGNKEKKHLGKRQRRQLMATPRPTRRPSKIGMKSTKTEAFPFWSTTLLYTKSAVRPSASSSALQKASKTMALSYTDLSFLSIPSQRDLGTLQMLSVHIRPPASIVFQSLSSAVHELSPSLTTASWTEFVRHDDLPSQTPPILELSQVPQQDMHSASKAQPKPHFTHHYLSVSVPASKIKSLRPVQPTVGVSVSSEEMSSEKIPIVHLPKELITNLTHSSLYAYLTPSESTSGDTTFTADLPVLSIMSILAKLRFPFSSVGTSLFLSGSNHQNQDLFSKSKQALESFISSPQTKELLFPEENSPPLTAVQTETPGQAIDLKLTDVTSRSDSWPLNCASAYKCGLVTDTSSVPQLYYSDNTLTWTVYSTQGFSISLFLSSVKFGLLSRTSSIPMELPSFSLSTSKELPGSFGFCSISPVEELLADRVTCSKVFKTDEHMSEPFMPVSQTNGLLYLKEKASTLTETHVKTPFWNDMSHLIYVTIPSAFVLSSQFLREDSLSHGTSQSHLGDAYDTLLLSLPIEFAGTPKLHFPMNYFSSYTSDIVRISVTCPDVLQLGESDLILASPLGTKVAFHGKFTSHMQEASTVTSLQTGLHATSLYPGLQGHTNASPRVVNAINLITATIGHKFSFSVPPDTFYDQEDGDASQLILGMEPADGSPMGPGNWLHFDSHFQTMHGYPLANDFQYSPQEFLLVATDSEGLKTSNTLTIELLRPTTIPCHAYTIRTKNSYHSFLRERERVYLFFEKLSKYLSSGSPGNMILLHLRPGSTLITWYDDSFCTRSNRCSRDEIQGVLVKLRLPGRNVHPDFVEAMLPEYNIYQTEDVAYGGTCFSNESLTSNQTLATFKDCHSWTRNVFFALIISICATIVIILMITFCYYKYHKKIIGSQSTSFHGRPFFSYTELEMDMLKSRKSTILEQEVPWPTELSLPVPIPSQQHLCRQNANLAASRLPLPPNYRLPPLYGIDESIQTYHSHNLKSYSKAWLY